MSLTISTKTHKERILEVLETGAKSYPALYKTLKDIPKSSIRRNLHELKHAELVAKKSNKWTKIQKVIETE